MKADNRPDSTRRKQARAVLSVATSWALPVAVALISMLAVDYVAFLTAADRFVKDIEITSLTPGEPVDPLIAVAAIDEDTLRQFTYREPVDRKFLSEAIRQIASYHPRAIGIDVLFDQPTEAQKDAALRQTLHEIKVPTVAAFTANSELADATQQQFLDAFVPTNMRALPNLATDQTDTVRWIFPGQSFPNYGFVQGFVPALAAKTGVATPDLANDACAPKCVEIVWRGNPGPDESAFLTIPIQDLANPQLAVLGKLVTGKVVLIGDTVTLDDRHRTPLSALAGRGGIMPGVMIHAQALSQILHHVTPRLAGFWGNFLVALIFAFIGAALGVWTRPLAIRSLAGVAFFIGLWAAGFALFRYSHLAIGLIAPSIAGIGSFGVLDALTGGQARRQREFIHNAFSRYVSPAVVEQLVSDPERLALEGERRYMTFLFSDIESFTDMSETIDSHALATLMNHYFDGVVRCVQEHGGMIDKFIGDSVFAIFNAPIDLEDHAACAVRCAMEIQKFTFAFSKEQKALGVPFGITRIGVNSGNAVIGNFGSSTRFTYTATGDAVNLASRLEGVNKHFHTRLIVSEDTMQLCPAIPFRPVGLVRVKGKTKPVEVFEPLDADTTDFDFVAKYKHAYEALKSGAPEAKTQFEALTKEHPDDPLVRLHLTRLSHGEDGVEIVMHEK